MEFFFCEKCGKRLTDQDIQAGKARHKQVKGVFCSNCAEGVMTVEFEAISPEMIDQFRKEQREKQRRATTPAAAAPPVPAPFSPPVRRPAPGSRPSIPVPSARRPTSGRMRPGRPRFGGDGAEPVAEPSRKPLIAAVLAAVAVVMALALVFMRGGNAPAIKDRVDAPDVPLAPQETANAAVPAKEPAPAKTSKPSESKASPAKTVAATQPTYEGPTRTVELFSTDDVEDAKGAGEVYTDRPEIVVSTQPISSGDLRFDLSKLGAVPVSAELTLYPSREPEAGSAILVHRLSGMDWKETDFKEMRPKNRTRGSPVRAAIKSTGPVTVDVTPLVAAMPENETALTLHLQPDARKCNVAFGSREGPEATRPRLVVKIPDLAGTVAKPQTSPPPQAGDGAVYLADLKQSGTNLMDPAHSVTHDGKEFPKSFLSQDIAKYRTAFVMYELNGDYERFKTEFALAGEKTGRLLFVALCDGKDVWHGEKSPCDIDITGVKTLKLAMWKDASDPPSLKGVWLSPRLYGKKPQTGSEPNAPAEGEGDGEGEVEKPAILDKRLGADTPLINLKPADKAFMESGFFRAASGKRHFKCLFTTDLIKHRSAFVTYHLNGAFAVFRTKIVLSPSKVTGLVGKVYCDGKDVPEHENGEWIVDVRGVKELKLTCEFPTGTEQSAVGLWSSPRLYKNWPEGGLDAGDQEAEAADPGIVPDSRTRLADKKSTLLSHLRVAGCYARDGSRYFRSLHTEGLAQNRECIATFNLDGQFGVFKTGFQEQPEGLKGLEIAVYRDGKQVPAPADNKWNVDVRGVKELKLVVSYPSGADPEAKAVWLDPTAWRVK